MSIIFALVVIYAAYRYRRHVRFQPGKELERKAKLAEPSKGKERAVIEAIMGTPNSVTSVAENKTLLQWRTFSYVVGMRFDENGICEGVVHEAKA